jgi:hypothetical protein
MVLKVLGINEIIVVFFEEEEINHSPGEVKLLKITSEKVKIIDNSLLES